jgi:hypothetical protein
MSKVGTSKEAEKEFDSPYETFEVGQVKVSDDGTRKSEIVDIDNETGQVSWKITQLPGFDKLYDELTDLVTTAKRTYVKTKDDKKFRDFYDEIRGIRNKVRTHLRNEYPDQYKRIVTEEEVDEISTTGGGAGSATFSAGTGMQYATPYAFKKKKKKVKEDAKHPGEDLGPGPKATEDGVKDNYYVKAFKYKLVPKTKDGTYVQKGSGLDVNKLF